MFKKILLSILFATISLGANDFSGDANCVALWRVEDGALITDSKGTNTLTNFGMIADTDVGDYKEGAASAYADELSDKLYIADADLDAGFPLKNGDSTGNISICSWMKISGFPISGTRYVLVKGETNKLSIGCRFEKATNWTFKLKIGINEGVDWEDIDHGSTIATGIWYHIGVTYQNSDKSYKIRIWDDNAGALLGGAEVTGNSTNNINIEDGPFSIGTIIGASWCCGGHRDEVVIFNDILTSGEIDQIQAGTYGADGAEDGAQVIIVEEE